MKDYIVRATAGNTQIRAFAAVTTNLVEEARVHHQTSPVATAALGRLLTGGVMMGSMMKNDTDMLTIQIKCSGEIEGLTVTADSQGNVKGYVFNPDVMLPPKNGKLDVGGALGQGVMTIIKDMGLKEPYSGQTILQTGEIAEDLTYYFATSEQVPSSVGLGVLIIVVFGFFFATVSSRMVGLIGSSNNPVSGMTIATLLFATVILKATGTTGITGMVGAISIGGIICIVAAIAGDASQDLKTGFIVGATPKKQQIGEIVGVVASAAAIGFVLYLLNEAWGYGTEKIPAAQATMMKMLVEGIMNGELPWALIFIGVFIAIVVEILHMPVMPFAVGMYLPFSLSAGIMAGGVVRILVEKKKGTEKEKKARTDRGLLFTSGMIAGEGIIGILLAIFAVLKINSKIILPFQLPQIGSLILFIALLALLYKVCMKADKE